jgi:hypothetical protein
LSLSPPVNSTKRYSTSCTQNQSEDSMVRLRKRSSLSRRRASSACRCLMSREMAATSHLPPLRRTWRVDSKGSREPSLQR